MVGPGGAGGGGGRGGGGAEGGEYGVALIARLDTGLNSAIAGFSALMSEGKLRTIRAWLALTCDRGHWLRQPVHSKLDKETLASSLRLNCQKRPTTLEHYCNVLPEILSSHKATRWRPLSEWTQATRILRLSSCCTGPY